MDRIAVISDVHANLEALKAVLQDIEERGINHIYCLGDNIAKGVHANECLELLVKKCEVMIQGNCDEYFSNESSEKLNSPRYLWNRQLISASWLEYLKKLPTSHEIYMSGRLIRFIHATPYSNHDFVVSASDIQKKLKMFQPGELVNSSKIADIVCYGHTHTPYFDKIFNRSLINVGSVGNGLEIFQDEKWNGNPLESVDATYLILEGTLNAKQWSSLSYQWVKVPYSIELELNNEIDNPEKENYTKELTMGMYRDMAKIKLK